MKVESIVNSVKAVIDASFAGSLLLPEKQSSQASKTIEQLAKKNVEIWVTSLFWYEVANILVMAQKRKIINASDIPYLFELIGQLNFKTDFGRGYTYAKSLTSIAIKNNLTSYDASYLDLCLRKKAKLYTFDEKLKRQAKKEKVAVGL